jgi:hypothetical protein
MRKDFTPNDAGPAAQTQAICGWAWTACGCTEAGISARTRAVEDQIGNEVDKLFLDIQAGGSPPLIPSIGVVRTF